MVYSALSDSTTTSQFTRRKKISFVGSITNDFTGFQVPLTVAHETAMQTDFNDIRFVSSTGTHIPYFIESKTDSSTCNVWFKTDLSKTDCEWGPYVSNPVLAPSGDEDHTSFSSVWLDGTTYHMFYWYMDSLNYRVIGHATSSDGEAWTKDTTNNPILEKSAGGWDNGGVAVSMVWKESSTWYMLYRGQDTSSVYHIGLATASSPGGTWTKEATNPVISASGAEDPWGIIKVGSTYYLRTNDTIANRHIDTYTSTDLTNWTPDTNNPIYETGRFCSFVFKRDSYYYELVCHYTSGTDYTEFELYRDTNPTFYSSDRVLVKTIKTCPVTGWDNHDEDTPCVLTTSINRDAYPNNELLTYYAGESGGTWQTGLLTETDIDQALSDEPTMYLWMYYGNDSLSAGSDGTDTFEFFDDFDSLTSTWTQTGTPIVASSIVTLDSGDKITSATETVGKDHALMARAKIESLAQSHWIGLMANDASTPFLIFHQSSTFAQNVYTNLTGAEHDYYTFSSDFAIYEILLSDSYVEYVEDGTSKADSNQTYGSNTVPIAFHSWTDGQIEVDWVAVRKYDSGLPVTTIGTEQHRRRIPQFV